MTDRPRRQLAQAAVALAAQVPEELICRFAIEVEKTGPGGAIRAAEVLPTQHYRQLAAEFLNAWQSSFAELSAGELAAALATAAAAEAANRTRQSLELVWTGPPTRSIAARQTEQVLLQPIESAERLFDDLELCRIQGSPYRCSPAPSRSARRRGTAYPRRG